MYPKFIRVIILLSYVFLFSPASGKNIAFKDTTNKQAEELTAEISSAVFLLDSALHPEKALTILDSIRPYVNETSDFNLKAGFLNTCFRTYKHLHQYSKALDCYEKYIEYADSINELEDRKQVAIFENKYQTAKRENTIHLTNTKINNRTTFILIVSSGLIILLILSIILLLVIIQKIRANKELVRKNIELVRVENGHNSIRQQHSSKQDNKYTESSLSEQQLNTLLDAFTKAMEKDNLYLDSDLNAQKLAGYIKTNTAYLSHAVNVHFKQSLSHIINQYRIKHARKMLVDNKFSKYTIESIARECGFRNISTFNRAFKQFTGITPTFFLKSIQKV